VTLAKRILLRAAEMDLADAPWEQRPATYEGHGIVKGLKAAVLDITGVDDVEAYNLAYEPLSLLCGQLVPDRSIGEVRSWAKDKTVEERAAFLLTVAKELP
jgi:hypothetical protein